MKALRILVFSLVAAAANGAAISWQGEDGNWTDANWTVDGVPNQTIATPPTTYTGQDFVFSIEGDVTAAARPALDGGSWTQSVGTVTMTGGGNLSGAAIGFNGTPTTVTLSGTAAWIVTGSGNAGTAMSGRAGTMTLGEDASITVTNKNFELRDGFTTILRDNATFSAPFINFSTESATASFFRIEAGNLTLTSSNPLRATVLGSGNAPSNRVNFTGPAGSAVIVHTDNSDVSNNLAAKLAGGHFCIDETVVTSTGAEVGGRRLEIVTTGTTDTLSIVSSTVSGTLVTSIAPAFPSPTLVENPTSAPNPGNTAVAAGNSKGQSFSLSATTSVTSFVFEIHAVTTPGTFTLQVIPAMDNLPWVAPVFADSGMLPAGLAAGDLLKVDLPAPLELKRGSYVVALTGVTASFALRTSNDPQFSQGALARKNSSTGNVWALGNDADADAVFAVLGTQSPPLPPAPANAPNIVYILADDLGWTDIQAGPAGPNVINGVNYGSNFYQTPNLARLASQGLSFTHCFVFPNCSPSRAAILSGQYPPRSGNGVYVVSDLNRGNGTPALVGPPQREDLPAAHIIVAEALQAGGYVTAHFGKYHVGGHDGGSATLPQNQGYDFNFGGGSAGSPGNYHASAGVFGGSIGAELDAYAANYTSSYISNILKGPAGDPLNARAVSNPAFPNGAANNPDTLAGTVKHVEDALGDAAIAFMRDHLQGSLANRPFYLQLWNYAVHTPVGNAQCRADLLAKYAGVPNGTLHGNDPYAGLVENMDQSVGRILDFLDAHGLSSNTLVIFMSDNGGHIGATNNDPLRHQKGSFWNGGLRVPLIIRQPGTIPAAQQTDSLVQAVDFYPTLIEHAGLALPVGVNFDGESFGQHMRNPAANPRDRGPIFYHFPGYLDTRARPCEVMIKRVDGKDYKLLYSYDLTYRGSPTSTEDQLEGLKTLSEPWELYCFSDDASETKDLINGSYSNQVLYGDIADTMANELVAWLNQDGADWSPTRLATRSTGATVPFLKAEIPEVTVAFSNSFRITSAASNPSTSEVTLTWNAEAGFVYDIEATSNLLIWDSPPLLAGVPGVNGSLTRTVADPGAAGDAKRFYRVVLRSAP